MRFQTQVPVGWELVRLKDVLALDQPGAWGNEPTSDESGVRVLRAADLTRDGKVELHNIVRRQLSQRDRERRLLNDGDIILERSGGGPGTPVGRVALVDRFGPMYCSNFCQQLRVDSAQCNPRYAVRALWHRYMCGVTSRLEHRTTGIRNLDYAGYLAFPILLPPLAEQRAIAAVLDSIDEAIERAEAVVAATERLRDALLHELLTRGVPGLHSEWKDAPGIGTIPACWDVKRLGDVLKTTTYGTSAALSGEGNISVLRMNNLQDGEVDFSDVRKADLTDQEVQELDLVKGDILFNRTNSLGLVGKIAIIRDTSPNLSFASYLVRLRVKKVRADHFWLSALLGSGTHQGRIRRLATPGVSQANINPTSLKSLAIPLPSLQEQRAIAALLESVHNVSRRAQATTDTLRTLKTSAADALLTGRVRTKQILVLSHDSLWGTSSIQTKVEGNCSNPGPQQQSVWHS